MTAEPLPLYSSAFSATHRRPDWRLWCAAAAVAAALVLVAPPFALGPRLEARVAPVFSHQAIRPESVVRSGRSLCWTWIRDKERAPEVLGLDVVLDTGDGDRSEPEIVNSSTGLPWHKSGAVGPGHYETQFCLLIPKFVKDETPVLVRQTLTFAGLWGLWTLSVPLPEIVAN